MSIIYDIDFETGDFSEFDTDTTGGAQLYVSSTDAISGTYSCNHDWKATAGATSVSNTTNIPNPFTVFRIGFKIKIKAGFAFGSATLAPILDWDNGSVKYSIKLAPSGGDVLAQVIFAAGGASDVFATTNLADGAIHTVEFRAVRESAPAAGDGIHAIYIDGFLEDELTNVGNDTEFTDIRTSANPNGNWRVRTFLNLAGDGVAGVITDDWILRNDDTPIYPGGISDDQFTAALSRPAAINMDGSFIYIGAIASDGAPVLIKFSTALNADGSIVFQPGAGDNIGVEVGKKDADIVWIAGNFGGTDTVEKSEDAGASFVVKDDGSFDPVTSFAVGPDSDERVLIFADAGGSVASTSIYETIDDGASWEQKSSGLGLVSKAVERLDINVEELVTGNESSATDNIDYSPNTGEDLEDYSTGFPEVDVTSLVVG